MSALNRIWLPAIIWAGISLTLAYQWFAPVVVFMRAEDWQVSSTRIAARVYGHKLRSCEFIKGAAVGYLRHGNVWEEVAFRFEDDPIPDNSKPTGQQSFDLWVWFERSRDHARPDSALVTVKHRCPFGEVQTEVGPFTIPPP